MTNNATAALSLLYWWELPFSFYLFPYAICGEINFFKNLFFFETLGFIGHDGQNKAGTKAELGRSDMKSD